MTEQPGIVIIGAGQAGGELAFTLRSKGWTAPVTMVGREPYLPYQRPPLSKNFLLGTTSADSLPVRPESVYYRLVFATGGTARRSSLPGSANRTRTTYAPSLTQSVSREPSKGSANWS